jgi:hypothetical protein
MWGILEWLALHIAQPLFQIAVAYAGSIPIRNELYWWLAVPALIAVLAHLLVTLPWWTKPATVSILLRMVRDMSVHPLMMMFVSLFSDRRFLEEVLWKL